MEEESYQFDITFSMVSCLSLNIVSSVGWSLESKALRHMTYGKSLFNRLKIKMEVLVQLGDDTTYHVRGIGSISF